MGRWNEGWSSSSRLPYSTDSYFHPWQISKLQIQQGNLLKQQQFAWIMTDLRCTLSASRIQMQRIPILTIFIFKNMFQILLHNLTEDRRAYCFISYMREGGFVGYFVGYFGCAVNWHSCHQPVSSFSRNDERIQIWRSQMPECTFIMGWFNTTQQSQLQM